MRHTSPIRLLVSAGATYEPIDEVRFLGNRSSGKMGCLIAIAGAIEGFQVTLLHASSSIEPSVHPRLNTIPFTSTRDLNAQLKEHWPSHDVLIMAAAVADFTPRGGQLRGKIKRDASMTLDCSPTEDLIAGLAQGARPEQRIIGFALEAEEDLATRAREKLARKQIDAIVANALATIESTHITATVYCKDGRTMTPDKNLSKPAFARWLIEHLQQITASE